MNWRLRGGGSYGKVRDVEERFEETNEKNPIYPGERSVEVP